MSLNLSEYSDGHDSECHTQQKINVNGDDIDDFVEDNENFEEMDVTVEVAEEDREDSQTIRAKEAIAFREKVSSRM
jgi:hypothetical protein